MDQMDDGMRKWVIVTAQRNYWRVAAYCDFEDLVQDGVLHFLRLKQRYPDVTVPHMMSLFKRTYHNHINDLSSRRSEDCPPHAERSGADDITHDNKLMELLAHAPPRVQAVLHVVLSDEVVKLRAPYRRHSNGVRETLHDRLCRMARVDPNGPDLPAAVREYLHAV